MIGREAFVFATARRNSLEIRRVCAEGGQQAHRYLRAAVGSAHISSVPYRDSASLWLNSCAGSSTEVDALEVFIVLMVGRDEGCQPGLGE